MKPIRTHRTSNRRTTIAALATASLLLIGCASPGPRPSPVVVPAPLPAQDVKDTHWGVAVPDPYRRLEDVKNPEVQQWMRAQADAAEAVLASLPGRKGMLERIREIEGAAGGAVLQVARTNSGRLFFLRRNPGENQFKLVWRDGPQGADHVVYDPEQGATAGGQPRAVMDFAPSRDGKRLAYAVQSGGGEIGTLHVIDVASGRELVPALDRIRYASASWLDDGSGLFYARLREGYDKLPPNERFGDRTTWFLDLATGQTRPVLSSSRQPALGMPTYASPYVFQVPGTSMAAAMVFQGVDRNRWLLVTDLAAARAGHASWRRVIASEDQVTALFPAKDAWYLLSLKGAPRGQILKLPLADPSMARTEVVVPESAGVIGEMAAARDGLYFTRRDGVNTSLHRVATGARTAAPIALPYAGGVDLKSADPDIDGVVMELSSWTRAFKTFAVDGAGRVARLPLAADGAYDAVTDIESREVMVRSHDGTMVPLSIVSKKGIKLDGRNPTILYGYGAYGVTDDPFFSPRVYAWIERGGIWATAHVRGGGVYGKPWHEAGRKTTKHNTWKDAIASAEWLVANGYASPQTIGIYGGSAGGIFVGRSITERPDLFAAAVPAVGVMDAVRSETSANGVANIPEFGTVKDKAEFGGLLAMSSYHHVKEGVRYPAVMATHGVNDIRVDVWQSAKFTSRLRAANPQGSPVLLHLEYDSGHGQGSSRTQLQQRTSDVWSFFLWRLGDPAFQPR